MTVISAVLSKECIAISTDSLITVKEYNTSKVIESKKSKIIPFERKRAAISYWGLTIYDKFTTYGFIQDHVNRAYDKDDLFTWSQKLGKSLQKELDALTTGDIGIGMHITGFERIDGYWIPELILCSNYTDTTYSSTGRIKVTRRSFRHVADDREVEKHGDIAYRMQVKKFFDSGRILYFNNGDPLLFNPFADAMLKGLEIGKRRRVLNEEDMAKMYRLLLTMCVRNVSELQTYFFEEGKRIVGGRPHNLSISVSGIFASDTGDV